MDFPPDDESKIIDTINNQDVIEDFSIIVENETIKGRNYSLGAGQYFEKRIEYSELTNEEFENKIAETKGKLSELFKESKKLESKLLSKLNVIEYDL